jgi:3-oxoacyl-[acyl-carrier-protein] synthase III
MRVGIVGLGGAMPARIRAHDDALFDDVGRSPSDEATFFGTTRERRALASDEQIEDLMVQAAQRALDDAGVEPRQVDRLYGASFVSRHLSPNGLYRVHAALGLPERALVVPVTCEFSNFVTGVTLASEAIAAERAKRILVVCGASLTRHVDFQRGHARPVGDGAGAALVAASERWIVLDTITSTRSDHFEEMAMSLRAISRDGRAVLPLDESGIPVPIYDMTLSTVKSLGVELPPELVGELLARNRLSPTDIALIPHQATRTLIDAWNQALRPAELFDTFERYGNMSLASVPVTLLEHRESIRSPFVVLLSAGTGTHFTALLLERGR